MKNLLFAGYYAGLAGHLTSMRSLKFTTTLGSIIVPILQTRELKLRDNNFPMITQLPRDPIPGLYGSQSLCSFHCRLPTNSGFLRERERTYVCSPCLLSAFTQKILLSLAPNSHTLLSELPMLLTPGGPWKAFMGSFLSVH